MYLIMSWITSYLLNFEVGVQHGTSKGITTFHGFLYGMKKARRSLTQRALGFDGLRIEKA